LLDLGTRNLQSSYAAEIIQRRTIRSLWATDSTLKLIQRIIRSIYW